MAFTCLDSALESFNPDMGYNNHFTAAFMSGFLFRCTAGLRPAFITGTVLCGAVGAFYVLDKKYKAFD
jgi:hypothetical protein